MNFGNSFTFDEGVTHLIAIGTYGILFFMTLIWLWVWGKQRLKDNVKIQTLGTRTKL